MIFLPQVFLSFPPSLFSSLSLTWLTSMDTPLAAHLLCRCLLQPYSLFLLLSFLAFSKPLSRQTSPAKMLPSSLCFISQISSPSLFSPKPTPGFLVSQDSTLSPKTAHSLCFFLLTAPLQEKFSLPKTTSNQLATCLPCIEYLCCSLKTTTTPTHSLDSLHSPIGF